MVCGKRCWVLLDMPQFRLQGEVGASGVVVRDIKQKLSYQKYRIDCDYDLLHEVHEESRMLCGMKLEIGIELLESTMGGWSLEGGN